MLSQSLAKLTINFQSSLSISDSASEVANSAGTAGDSCSLQQYCDTGCQTDIMGEVQVIAAPPCLQIELLSAAQMITELSKLHHKMLPLYVWNESMM